MGDSLMLRSTCPMIYWVPCSALPRYPQDLRMHRGRPSLAELRRIVRTYPLAWVTA